MKILLANWVYNWGSTGYIVRDLRNSYIKKGHEVYVASAVNWGTYSTEVFLFSNKLLLALYGLLTKHLGLSRFMGSWISTIRFIYYLKKTKPDVVHIHILNNHALNMYYVLNYLGKHNFKTVITHHAEFYYTGCCGYSFDCNNWKKDQCNCCPSIKEVTGSLRFANPHRYWLKMQKVFNSYQTDNLIFTAVSPWVKQRSQESQYLNRFRCEVVKNGIETSVFYHRMSMSAQVLKRLSDEGISDYYLYVTASFVPDDKENIKGGYYIVELAKRRPDLYFIVVATSGRSISELPSNIFVWGKAGNQSELAELYSQAKLTILTSKKETFSMICAESLCCGTPVIGFEAGGPETIAMTKYSSFCKYGDIDALLETLALFDTRQFDKNRISTEAINTYSKKVMSSEYLKIYNSLLYHNSII